MTVRADDIALRGLSQDAFEAGIRDHPRYPVDLLAWVAVVEVHGALGIGSATVGARHRPKLVEDVSVVSPALALLGDARSSGGRRPRGETLPMLAPRTKAMAVGADDVALGDLSQQLRATLEQGPARQEVERLR